MQYGSKSLLLVFFKVSMAALWDIGRREAGVEGE